MREPNGCRSNYWLQTLILDLPTEQEAVLGACNDAGFMVRPAWVLNHYLPAFAGSPRMSLPMAESLERRIVNLPSSAQLALEVTNE